MKWKRIKKNQKINKIVFGPAADETSEGKQLELSKHLGYVSCSPSLLQGTNTSKMASSFVISANKRF